MSRAPRTDTSTTPPHSLSLQHPSLDPAPVLPGLQRSGYVLRCSPVSSRPRPWPGPRRRAPRSCCCSRRCGTPATQRGRDGPGRVAGPARVAGPFVGRHRPGPPPAPRPRGLRGAVRGHARRGAAADGCGAAAGGRRYGAGRRRVRPDDLRWAVESPGRCGASTAPPQGASAGRGDVQRGRDRRSGGGALLVAAFGVPVAALVLSGACLLAAGALLTVADAPGPSPIRGPRDRGRRRGGRRRGRGRRRRDRHDRVRRGAVGGQAGVAASAVGVGAAVAVAPDGTSGASGRGRGRGSGSGTGWRRSCGAGRCWR